MNEIQDHRITPTNGRSSTIGSSTRSLEEQAG